MKTCQEKIRERLPSKIFNAFPKTIDEACASGMSLRSIEDLLFRMWHLRCKTDGDIAKRDEEWIQIVAALDQEFPWLNEDQWFEIHEAFRQGVINSVDEALAHAKSNYPNHLRPG